MKKLWNFIKASLFFVVVRIIGINCSEESWNNFLQFIKFGIVGVSNTIVSYLVYLSALWIFHSADWLQKTDYLMAQFLGFLISVLWSFVLNRKFVFQADREDIHWQKALLKTYASYAFTGLFLSGLLSVLWIEWMGLSKLIAPILNLIISVPVNFLLNKFWAFK